ncbi:MAG: hypothetical protein V1873_00365 [Verrucomicrobiota bacterium]
MKRHVGWHPTAGLWWAAFLILLVGGGIAYVFSLDETSPAARTSMATTLMVTIIAAGIFVICATSNWWMRR